jgi:quercetin dioxygenase-like cupin family protein
MTGIGQATEAFQAKRFDAPDDRKAFPHGGADVVDIGGRRLMRVTFEPGFRWSKDMAPVAGTPLCQVRHVFLVLSGRMGLQLPDGAVAEVGPGELVALAPKHDSWTVGDEPVVFLDMDPKTGG